jgi:hypothetical protein
MSDGVPAIRDEIIRCGRDPAYFIKTYVKIQHPVRGLVPFKLYDYQEQLVQDYQEHRFNIILKSRQIGISETTAAYITWLILFHRNKNVLVMATKADTAKNIVKKIRTALKKLPPWLLIADVLSDNRLSVELSNGSQCKAIASSDDAGRSEAVSLLVIDEAAFVKNLDELWTGLLPTVQAGGNVVVLSTPNGVGNKFETLYREAIEGKNDFYHTKLMWWVHPERISDLEDDPNRPGFKTSSWYRNEIKTANMSERDIAQELECNFNASGDTFFNPHDIEWVRDGAIEPSVREHWDRNLFYWFEPQAQKRYFVSADVARGDGKDYSVGQVWSVEDMQQVAEYYGKIPVEEFAHILCDMGHLYNNALLVVENNNIGMACLEHIRLAGYENVYYSRKGDSKPGQAVHSAWGPPTDEYTIGFTMQAKVRPLVFSKMEEFVRNRKILIRSQRLATEMKFFIWEGGEGRAPRMTAQKGYNDDAVAACAIGCWIKDTFISPGEMAANLDAKLLESISMKGHVNTEILGASKNPEFVSQRNMGVFTSQNPVPTRIRLPKGQNVDFSWLQRG